MKLEEQLKLAHYIAVKAAQRYEAATPGTRTKEKLYQSWQKAEENFKDRLMCWIEK